MAANLSLGAGDAAEQTRGMGERATERECEGDDDDGDDDGDDDDSLGLSDHGDIMNRECVKE